MRQRSIKEPRKINEWLEWYEEHGGTQDLQLDPEEHIHFHPEHGFITYLLGDDTIEIHHLAGDGKYWAEFLMKLVMPCTGTNKINAYTRRNPRAWIRKYGGHIRGYYMEVSKDELKV